MWHVPLCLMVYSCAVCASWSRHKFVNKEVTSWLIKLTRGGCRGLPCYAVFPEKPFVFWKDNHGSLADVILLVGVHKSLSNFWFKRMQDFHQIEPNCSNQKWDPSDFCLERAERYLLCKSLPLGSQFNQFSYHAWMFVLCQRIVEAISQYPKP